MLLAACQQRHAAQHLLEQPGFGHHRQRRHRMRGEQELDQLHADALARQLLEAGAAGDAGGDARRIGRAVAIGGVEAEEAQDAQIVLGDAPRRRRR